MKALNSHHNESGQILLILTVGIVALLGMVALAVDGGMIYADRRIDQNAADASSFAGAGAAALELDNSNYDTNKFDCTGAFLTTKAPNPSHGLYDTIIAARNSALLQASSNNFAITYPLENQHGLDIMCVSSGKANYLEIRTVISSTVQTAFAHLFYKGEVRNTVEAVARVNVAAGIGGGGVLTHLNTDCSNPLVFGMTNDKKPAYIDGASSNGCIFRKGSQNTVFSPVEDPNQRIPIYYANNCVNFDDPGCPADGEWTADFEKFDEPVEKYYLEELITGQENMTRVKVKEFWNDICGTTYISKKNFKPGEVMSPGRYETVAIQSGSGSNPVVMQSGLYCVESNFSVNWDLQSHGDGVTIIFIEDPTNTNKQGNITIQAGVKVILTPRRTGDPRFNNLLMYFQKYNTSTNRLAGNSDTYFEGTIWAPDGSVKFSGTGNETSSDVQIIADQIEIMGAQTLNLKYDKDKTWTAPTTVSLVK
jgi:hypothetical protein